MTHVADDKKTSKFFRFLHSVSERALKGSLDIEQFMKVVQILIDKNVKTKNLLQYVVNDCPKIGSFLEAPKKEPNMLNYFDEESYFCTQYKGVDTHFDLVRYVGLKFRHTRSACDLKWRTLKNDELLFGKPKSKSYNMSFAGVVDLGQVAQLIDAQRKGNVGQLSIEGGNLFPLLGKNGLLYVGKLEWNSNILGWMIDCDCLEKDSGTSFMGDKNRFFSN